MYAHVIIIIAIDVHAEQRREVQQPAWLSAAASQKSKTTKNGLF